MTMKEIYRLSLWFQLFLASVVGILVYNASVPAKDAEEWMPDPALREAVREALDIPDEIPIHPGDMAGLHNLFLIEIEHGIRSLKGLEYAVNLRVLVVDTSEVSDLTPLTGLENLEFLAIVRSEVSDLTPLAGLENLRVLKLSKNRISDITSLAGLVNLEVLQLQQNQIEDFTPLVGLVNLKELNLSENQIEDFTPILKLPKLQNVEVYGNHADITELIALNQIPLKICALPQYSIEVRLENINTPPVFAAWHNIINLPTIPWEERITYHHLYFSYPDYFAIEWFLTPDGWKLIGNIERAKSIRNALLSQNPNMIFLAVIRYYYGHPNEYPEDWPYWLRDTSGQRVEDGNWGVYLIDYTHSEIQDMFVQQAIEIAKCGLYDGIFLDHWSGRQTLEVGRTLEEEHTARDRILQGIRKAVGDNFLIMVNTNRDKIPRWAPYVNGTFMETTRKDGYTYAGLREIESTLLWSEQNFREPQINALEGWGLENEPLDSPKNRQWMRLFTTMSLTHSDGYVLYTTGINSPVHTHAYEIWEGHSEEHVREESHDHQHQHYWYDFWDAPLGRPVGGDETKAQLYENREGLFIREFTNGWAVYNRSGKAQEIELPQAVSGWSSGVKDKRRHTLADLDGEIYLKAETPPTADLNGDGVVNIQDLVIVANAFGKAEPDLNGDGVVNIQDLVIVANAF